MPETQTNAIVAGISRRQPNFDYTMTELANLAAANNYVVVDSVRQNVDQVIAATYFGKGKAEEIGELARLKGGQAIIVNDELTPSQLRNLEKIIGMDVIDRTQLILDIFGTRARSKQAKTQVEIAQLRYALPRLRQRNANFDQQSAGTGAGGAGLANRGSGETQLELDKRRLTKRISRLKQELADEAKDEETRSAQRNESHLPTVALVGYTNAGKSTTMNGLLNLFAEQGETKNVEEKDMLFATLDTSVRKIELPSNRAFLLSDTVGFVSKLPTKLVDSFKATLAEAKNADLLLHVVDYADPHYQDMMAVTEATLADIGIHDVPTIIIDNKADLRADTVYPEMVGDSELIFSARDQASLEKLAALIEEKLFAHEETHRYLIPFSDGQVVSYINDHLKIDATEYTDNGTRITAAVDATQAGRLAKYLDED